MAVGVERVLEVVVVAWDLVARDAPNVDQPATVSGPTCIARA